MAGRILADNSRFYEVRAMYEAGTIRRTISAGFDSNSGYEGYDIAGNRPNEVRIVAALNRSVRGIKTLFEGYE